MRTVIVLLIGMALLAALGVILLLLVDDAHRLDELEPAPVAPAPADPARPPVPSGVAPAVPPATPARDGEPEPASVARAGPADDPLAARVVSAFRRIPVAGARIRLRAAGLEPVEAQTDRSGRIPAEVELHQGLDLRIDAEGFHPLEVELDAERNGRVFVLQPAGVLQGEVVDPAGVPQPWANLQLGVVIEDAAGNTIGVPWAAADRMTCDPQGRFRLDGLDPRGRYLVVASVPRLGAGAKSDLAPSAREAAAPVTVRLGGDGELRVLVSDPTGAPVMMSRAVLSGRPEGLPGAVVVGDAGRALADLMRKLQFRFRRAMTGSLVRVPGWKNGYGYVYDRMPPGDYVLEIEARGFKLYSTRIEIGPDGPIQHEARLEPEDVAFTGVVLDAFGSPVASADLSVHTDGDVFRGYQNVSSGPDGSFTVRGPPKWSEPLSLQVAKEGHESVLIQVPPGTTRLTVQLHRSGRVRGEVSLEDAETGEVVFEFVRSRPQAALERRIHLVRRNWGHFQFTLPRGDYTVRVTAPGYEDHRAELTVPSGRDAVLEAIVLRRR